MPAPSTPYDEVPYLSLPYFETHPDRLRLVGHLFGMSPAPVDRCRVLEIGCGAGGNIIPIAALHPEATVVGVDLAGTQIAEGQDVVAALGLRNIELRHLDLQDVREGTFDYIIAHGVYSWVPPAVAARLLDIFAERLAPQGVALVSHNVKPGWYARRMAREMMLWHVGDRLAPAERIDEARAFLEFLVRAARPEEDRHRALLQSELEMVSSMPDWVVLHDWLADVNQASYFHEVAAELPPRGLQFLGDSGFAPMFPSGFTREVKETLAAMARDVIGHEQLLDFLRNRAFRQTLVCRAGIPLDRALGPARLQGLHLSAQLHENAEGVMRTPQGHYVRPDSPAVRAALLRLAAAWPVSVPFAEVAAAAGDEADTVAAELLDCLCAGLIQAALTPARCVKPGGDRPYVPPHIRLQADRGPHATSLRHEYARLSPEARRVIELLDGSRDRAQLAKATVMPVAAILEQLAAKGLLQR